MEQAQLPKGLSGFSWALVGLCFPILLWPLALLLSPALLENPNLSATTSLMFACIFWFYPFLLGIIARMLFKLHQKQPHFAVKILVCCAIIFWVAVGYIIVNGLR
ncbi:Uncharacterised protein [Actinobacillus porcinus]|uniref:Aspartate-semialdehyde dehydrogenase n=1 Tax=Actinobacillus porcinus TaxID=51048 RepID=A0ABY6TMJ9_9PAST|nr:DUF5389 family protein [Actinobacillus porcinus]VFY93940.1 Uncharacterised protein [Actinobacillus porcinus]VTU09451.1 Uncharacterised protein [Actinobacillus porcinus]